MSRLNKLLKPFKMELHKTKSLQSQKAFTEDTINRIAAFYQDFNICSQGRRNDGISAIVFSKDRAMQLHALITSYFFYTKNAAPLTVLLTCSDDSHKRAYEDLQRDFSTQPVRFVTENNFNTQLKDIIKDQEGDRLFFMTDDAIFLEHYDLHDCLEFDPFKNIFSLRMGEDLDFCFAYNKPQQLPRFITEEIEGSTFNTWIWKDMEQSPDWNYPLSVDATIFLRKEILAILEHIQFNSPNSLEAGLQLYKELFLQRKGICFSKAKYVNIPCNIVQQEFKNNFIPRYSTADLRDKFLAGLRIDWKKLEGMKAPAAQQAIFDFI